MAGTYRAYLLAVLTAILASNYVDRLALGLLLQEIKEELLLSDTQLGLLSGIAFALFYSLMGVPIARWADRGNRISIISLTAATWSIMVALCGAVGSFWQLLLVRVGVAVGEAGCIPPAHSLIADYFVRAERPRAVAIYMLGAPLSALVGYFLAGWLNEFYGWRATFMYLAIPGVALAVLARYSLKEPRTSHEARGELQGEGRPPGIKEVCTSLAANATFCHLLIAYSIIALFSQGIVKWQPAFFVRSYGLQTGELGTWFAVIYGVSGLAGTYLGGEWAARRAIHNERLQLKVMAAGCLIFGALLAGVYVSHNKYMSFGLLGLATLGAGAIIGPLLAMTQTLVRPRMRAMSIAIFYLFSHLIGMGLGPLLAGALSDALRRVFGEESLRYALLALCPGYAWAAWHLLRAIRTVNEDIGAGQNEDGAEVCTADAAASASRRNAVV